MVQIQANKDSLGSKESFHAEVSTLDTLLGYTEKDDREGAFEASLFAELFREMLEARFGRSILRTLELLEREDRWVWPQKCSSAIPGCSCCPDAWQPLHLELSAFCLHQVAFCALHDRAVVR